MVSLKEYLTTPCRYLLTMCLAFPSAQSATSLTQASCSMPFTTKSHFHYHSTRTPIYRESIPIPNAEMYAVEHGPARSVTLCSTVKLVFTHSVCAPLVLLRPFVHPTRLLPLELTHVSARTASPFLTELFSHLPAFSTTIQLPWVRSLSSYAQQYSTMSIAPVHTGTRDIMVASAPAERQKLGLC